MSSIPKVFLLEDLFFVKNKMLDPKVTMSLLTNYYRPISLINLDSLSNLDMHTHGSVEKKVSKSFYFNQKLVLFFFLLCLLSCLVLKWN